MHGIEVTAVLFENQHRAFPIVHEAGAAIGLPETAGNNLFGDVLTFKACPLC